MIQPPTSNANSVEPVVCLVCRWHGPLKAAVNEPDNLSCCPECRRPVERIRPDDQVIITGTASCPHGQRFEGLHAAVATVSAEGYFKVWPIERDGKIWFPWQDIESLKLVQRFG